MPGKQSDPSKLSFANDRFFWGTSCFFCVIYCYFRLPEVTGRAFSEIDILFERKIPARAFKRTEVNVFDSSVSNLLAVAEKDKEREAEKV